MFKTLRSLLNAGPDATQALAETEGLRGEVDGVHDRIDAVEWRANNYLMALLLVSGVLGGLFIVVLFQGYEINKLQEQQPYSVVVFDDTLELRDGEGQTIDTESLPERQVTGEPVNNYEACINALREVITDYPLGDREDVTKTICGSRN